MGHGILQNSSSSSLFSRNNFNNICLKPQVKIVGTRLPQETPGLVHSGAQLVSILLTSLNLDHAFCPALGFPQSPWFLANCSEFASPAGSHPLDWWSFLAVSLVIAYPILS